MALKVTCVIASVSRLAGGIFEAERGLQRAAGATPGVSVRALGLRDRFTRADEPAWAPLPVDTVSVRGPAALGWSPDLAPRLLQSAPDVVYGAGLWMYPSRAVLEWVRRTGRPSIAAPHGMLDPWAVARGRWKKRIAGWWFEDERLRRASTVRALCGAEARAIRAYGLTNPICVIPNGVEPPPAASAGPAPWADAIEPGRKVLLYLGRLHPKKGLDALLSGWALATRRQPELRRDWRLVVAGWDQGGYERELRRRGAGRAGDRGPGACPGGAGRNERGRSDRDGPTRQTIGGFALHVAECRR
jgi:glycosyltransferase involved in cell wall biosynthesis